jgi:hypothetical protein
MVNERIRGKKRKRRKKDAMKGDGRYRKRKN